jgi:hypothetical protein
MELLGRLGLAGLAELAPEQPLLGLLAGVERPYRAESCVLGFHEAGSSSAVAVSAR